MKIEILPEAKEDLLAGYYFYEKQAPGLGSYFLDNLFSDIESLPSYTGIHRIFFGYYRCLSRRFPFAIYYRIKNEIIQVQAVLDCRQKPSTIRRYLPRKN